MSKKDEIVEDQQEEGAGVETAEATGEDAPVAEGDAEDKKPAPRKRTRRKKAVTKAAEPDEDTEETAASEADSADAADDELADEPADEVDEDVKDASESASADEDGDDEPESAGDDEDSGDDEDDGDERSSRSRGRRRRGRTRSRRRTPRDSDGDDDAGDSDADGDEATAPSGKGKEKLRATPLWGLHKERRAKMVPFAGYDMPVQYKRGIMSEHRQTRERAGLFDVSHMGQAFLTLEGKGGHDEIASLIEELVPGNIKGLKPGGVRYTLLLNDEGGIIDDLMITRPEADAGEGMLFLVVNAGCKEKDFAYISEKLEGRAKLTPAGDRALIALQGPQSARVLARLAPFVSDMPFMSAKACRIDGVECIVSRCGYTGEDGYEISVPNEMAESFSRKLLAHREVALVGLGARDSLRLEAGLCLYGHDITEETTPAEADLMWTIPKRRREAADFPGAEKILKLAEEGVTRKRVGIQPQAKAPAREGTDVVDADGNVIGTVTSGGFGPSVRTPVAMGYVDAAFAEIGTEIGLMVRGQSRPAAVVALPFVEPNQFRPGKAAKKAVEAEDAPAEDTSTSEDDDKKEQDTDE